MIIARNLRQDVVEKLLAAVGDVAEASWRASAVGVYRLWRDMGYAVGAILSGLIADAVGVDWAIAAVGILTVLSGALAAAVMRETLRGQGRPPVSDGGVSRQGAAPPVRHREP